VSTRELPEYHSIREFLSCKKNSGLGFQAIEYGWGGGVFEKVSFKEIGGACGNRGRGVDNSGFRTTMGMVHSTGRPAFGPLLYPLLSLLEVGQLPRPG
jgi:hypothetical protein